MWVTSSDEEALKFANERLMPSLRTCAPVAKQIPNDRSLAKSMEILFPTMMLEVVGANSKAKLQSRTRRFLLLDEVRNWPAWALPMVLKRVRTWWNSRVVILTTPGMERDTVHMEFLNGSQNRYHVPCLACGIKSELRLANLRAEHPITHQCVKWSAVPGARDQDGRWDFEILAPALRYACPACHHLHADTPAIRRRLALEGHWVSHNPKAPAHLTSYTWSALLPTWVKWRKVVEELLLAEAALEFGNHEPMKAFITETLGEPWQDKLRYAKTEGYLDKCQEDYDPRLPWTPEARRFMTIDVQGKGGRHFYWVIRQFAQGGTSRSLA
jgi:phage terminase large subunit GpA-like protein